MVPAERERAVAILGTEAIVLRTIDYSETSLIVWFFTREHGRLHLIAKGARRPRSPFEGALEPLVRGELHFYRRSRGSGLEIAKEFDPLDLHMGLRRDLGRLHRGLYVAELLTQLSEHDLPAVDAYDAAAAALGELARGDAASLDAALVRCELRLLAAGGLAPCLDRCVRCGAPRPPGAWFSPAAGGVLCRDHAGEDRRARSASPGALRTLEALGRGGDVALGRDTVREVRGLLDAFFTWHLERPLRLAKRLV